MDPEQWQQIIQLNGGVVGQPVPQYKIDPVSGQPIAQDNPPVRYTFNNGKYIIVQPATAPGGVGPPEPGAFNVTNQGTAILPGSAKNLTQQKPFVYGGVPYQWDATQGQWVDAKGIPVDDSTQQKITIAQQNADARTQGADTNAYRASVYGTVATENAATQASRAGTYATSVANQATAKQMDNLIAQGRLAWQQVYQQALLGFQQGKLTLQQAQQYMAEQHQQVGEWLQQRGQDLQYADSQGKTAQQLYGDILTKTVPAGANQSLTDIMNQQGKSQGLTFNLQPGGQTAPDPVNFVQGATQRALQNLQSGNLGSIIGQNPRTVGQPGAPQPMQAQPAATPFVPGNNESPVQPGFSLSSTPPVSPTAQMAPPFGLPR